MQSSTDITPSVQPQSQAQHQQAYNMSSTMSDDPTTSKENLEHLRTTTASIPISPGLAEKLYLRSASADGRLELTTVSSAGIENDWRKRLGNPASMSVYHPLSTAEPHVVILKNIEADHWTLIVCA